MHEELQVIKAMLCSVRVLSPKKEGLEAAAGRPVFPEGQDMVPRHWVGRSFSPLLHGAGVPVKFLCCTAETTSGLTAVDVSHGPGWKGLDDPGMGTMVEVRDCASGQA